MGTRESRALTDAIPADGRCRTGRRGRGRGARATGSPATPAAGQASSGRGMTFRVIDEPEAKADLLRLYQFLLDRAEYVEDAMSVYLRLRPSIRSVPGRCW